MLAITYDFQRKITLFLEETRAAYAAARENLGDWRGG
jgi:hypothetical protein